MFRQTATKGELELRLGVERERGRNSASQTLWLITWFLRKLVLSVWAIPPPSPPRDPQNSAT